MKFLAATIACVVGLGVAPARAAEHEGEAGTPPTGTPAGTPGTPGTPEAEMEPAPIADQPYGWQMMTPEERAAHCNAMRSAQTAEQREQLRAAHHAQMVERARQRGIAMPEQAPQGMGPGAGCRGMRGPG